MICKKSLNEKSKNITQFVHNGRRKQCNSIDWNQKTYRFHRLVKRNITLLSKIFADRCKSLLVRRSCSLPSLAIQICCRNAWTGLENPLSAFLQLLFSHNLSKMRQLLGTCVNLFRENEWAIGHHYIHHTSQSMTQTQ